jgi:hypothetical protein
MRGVYGPVAQPGYTLKSELFAGFWQCQKERFPPKLFEVRKRSGVRIV